MTCKDLIDFLDDYLAGALPPGQRERFEEHLAVCRDCANYLDSYKRTVLLGRAAFAMPEDPVPQDVPQDLLRAILAARPSGPS